VTGQLNHHPQAAIKFLDSDDNKNFLKFFDELVVEV
jgi:hypothetical protein